MSRRAGSAVFALAFVLLAANPAVSQLSVVPAAVPTVTAENEPWYLNGEPITYAGNFYYPSGAQVYFNANEMVRSGFFMGIPLYTRTTIEPYSIVYVPLPNGRLQPYARPRTEELTGTAASLPSSELPRPSATVPPWGHTLQAAGPPSQTARTVPVQIPRPAVVEPTPPLAADTPKESGTSGRIGTQTSTCACPQAPISIFIEYNAQRWYALGAPQPLETSTMDKIGTYHGFDVWTKRDDRSVIYIPVTIGSSSAVAYGQARPGEQVR
ncbi:MAG TPA: hypothetical protein VHG09_06465 [Longimicrobiales bacterium]|nr:hypothetical protein [Longimicrobiales bacterium]